MQALFFAGPMLADGINAMGEEVSIDGVTDFHLHDTFSCRAGQEGRGAACSPGRSSGAVAAMAMRVCVCVCVS
jgi:hypothetical protein